MSLSDFIDISNPKAEIDQEDKGDIDRKYSFDITFNSS